MQATSFNDKEIRTNFDVFGNHYQNKANQQLSLKVPGTQMDVFSRVCDLPYVNSVKYFHRYDKIPTISLKMTRKAHKFVDVRILDIRKSQEMDLVAQRLSPFTDPYKIEYKHPRIPSFVFVKNDTFINLFLLAIPIHTCIYSDVYTQIINIEY